MFSQAATPSWKLRFDTLGAGESLQPVLRRGGLSDSAAAAAIQAALAAKALDERRIPAGMQVTIRSESADSAPSEVVLQLDEERIVRLKRVGTEWTGAEEKLPWVTDPIVVAGTIQSNLYGAVDDAASSLLPKAARDQLTNAMAEQVYNYKIDMSRELQKGDQFKVMAERSVG